MILWKNIFISDKFVPGSGYLDVLWWRKINRKKVLETTQMTKQQHTGGRTKSRSLEMKYETFEHLHLMPDVQKNSDIRDFRLHVHIVTVLVP